MPGGSPPAEVELTVSSSSPVTPRTPTATHTNTDVASSDGEGGAAEFASKTDVELRATIRRWRSNTSHCPLPDGGEKMRTCLRRIDKELARRGTASRRKENTARRQALHPSDGSDPFAFNAIDEPNQDSIAGKHHPNSSFNRPTKIYGQDKGAAFTKELNLFRPGKHANLKKDGQSARCLVFHELKNDALCPKSADHKCLNMDDNIIHNRRNIGSNSISRKSTNRWGHYKNHAFQPATLFSSSKRKKKKHVVLLDDEDTEPAKPLDVQMINKRDEPKIYYPCRTDPETVELTYSDMKCLQPEEYLKSPVINFYIQYLKKSRHREDMYIFNTYFYSKLQEALSRMGNRDSQFTEFSKLRRWWKSADIFKKAYIIIPVHGNMHWSLIIICMPTKETESGPMVLHLDSLGLHYSNGVFVAIQSYLEAEWRHLQSDPSYDIPFSWRIWEHLPRSINKEKVEVPRQRNEFDCGIFMLYYIDRFIQEAPERLTRQNLSMFGRDWFKSEQASGLRQGILAILLDIFQSARLDDGASESESHDSLSDDHPKGEDEDGDAIMAITVESSDE